MKRTLALLALAWFAGCMSREPRKPPSSTVKEMFHVKGCTNCHDIRKRPGGPGGPSFEEIAARYPPKPDVIRLLTRRVLHGTSGHWTGFPLKKCPDKTGEGFKEYEIRWMIEWILHREWENKEGGR